MFKKKNLAKNSTASDEKSITPPFPKQAGAWALSEQRPSSQPVLVKLIAYVIGYPFNHLSSDASAVPSP